MSDSKEQVMPELTLDPFGDTVSKQEVVRIEPEKEDEVKLTPEEQQAVDNFAQKIDITNAQLVLQYGSAAQSKLADFSENTLNNVRTKDLGKSVD